MNKTTPSTSLLLNDLKHFTGTECYYYNRLFPNLRYTDGVKYLAENAGAYWLIDAIFSHQMNPLVRDNAALQEFQVWKLTVSENQKACLQVSDGNDAFITIQELEYTDFCLPEITLYLQNKVLMLTSEY